MTGAEMIIGGGGLAVGVVGTLLAVSKLYVSKDTCQKCGNGTSQQIQAVKDDIKDVRDEVREICNHQKTQTELLHEIKGKLDK